MTQFKSSLLQEAVSDQPSPVFSLPGLPWPNHSPATPEGPPGSWGGQGAVPCQKASSSRPPEGPDCRLSFWTLRLCPLTAPPLPTKYGESWPQKACAGERVAAGGLGARDVGRWGLGKVFLYQGQPTSSAPQCVGVEDSLEGESHTRAPAPGCTRSGPSRPSQA